MMETRETGLPEDDRASTPPADEGEAEPTPGEDAGPQGNPGQDEEALSQEQQEAGQDDPA